MSMAIMDMHASSSEKNWYYGFSKFNILLYPKLIIKIYINYKYEIKTSSRYFAIRALIKSENILDHIGKFICLDHFAFVVDFYKVLNNLLQKFWGSTTKGFEKIFTIYLISKNLSCDWGMS